MPIHRRMGRETRSGKRARLAARALLAGWLLLAAWLPCASGREAPLRVGVVVSMNIRPYFEALEGVRSVFRESRDVELVRFFLEDSPGNDEAALAQRIFQRAPDAVIAIGPEATRLVFSHPYEGVRVYSMVLHPQKLMDPAVENPCGVSLQVPFAEQARIFRRALPGIGRIGILFDRDGNEDAESAVSEASEAAGEVIPLPVRNREEIPRVLRENWSRIDGLWFIPDRTVISESLVKFIIKEAMSNGVATLGYNRFFYESGAAMALVLDYRAAGAEAAAMARESLRGGDCRAAGPPFAAWLNIRVAEALGIREIRSEIPGVEIGP